MLLSCKTSLYHLLNLSRLLTVCLKSRKCWWYLTSIQYPYILTNSFSKFSVQGSKVALQFRRGEGTPRAGSSVRLKAGGGSASGGEQNLWFVICHPHHSVDPKYPHLSERTLFIICWLFLAKRTGSSAAGTPKEDAEQRAPVGHQEMGGPAEFVVTLCRLNSIMFVTSVDLNFSI